jgi:hypothetical protein
VVVEMSREVVVSCVCVKTRRHLGEVRERKSGLRDMGVRAGEVTCYI